MLRGEDQSQFADRIAPCHAKMGRIAARIAGVDQRDDVVQNALLRAWAKRHQFDARRGTFSSWLLTIVANEARRSRRRTGALPVIRVTGAPSRGLDEDVDLALALKRLPPRQRLAIDCYYFADLSVEEAAAVMNCSIGTVKSTLADARSRLRLQLEVSSD